MSSEWSGNSKPAAAASQDEVKPWVRSKVRIKLSLTFDFLQAREINETYRKCRLFFSDSIILLFVVESESEDDLHRWVDYNDTMFRAEAHAVTNKQTSWKYNIMSLMHFLSDICSTPGCCIQLHFQPPPLLSASGRSGSFAASSKWAHHTELRPDHWFSKHLCLVFFREYLLIKFLFHDLSAVQLRRAWLLLSPKEPPSPSSSLQKSVSVLSPHHHLAQLMQRCLLSNFFSPSTTVPKPVLCAQPIETPQPPLSSRVGLSSEWDGSSQPKKFLDGVMNRSKVNIIRANTGYSQHTADWRTLTHVLFFFPLLAAFPYSD